MNLIVSIFFYTGAETQKQICKKKNNNSDLFFFTARNKAQIVS